MTRKRMEMAKTDPSKKGGRPRTHFSKEEAEEKAMERMLPKALQVLQVQLDSPDERVSQAAAVKVLEYVKGKPKQTVDSNVKQIAAIRYESAAWSPSGPLPKEILESQLLELPVPDSDVDPD